MDEASKRIRVGRWTADHMLGVLTAGGASRSVEPKVMDLLFLLASSPGEVFAKAQIFEALWPGVLVGEDSLSGCVAKLRTALDDDARSPTMIQTIPKRGYRLIAAVQPASPVARPGSSRSLGPDILRRRRGLMAGLAAGLCLLSTGPSASLALSKAEVTAAQLTGRANDHYYQFARADNEAAIALYQRAIESRPDHAPAYAGLANSLVQQVVRWSQPTNPSGSGRVSLYEAVASGRTRTPGARQKLERALTWAELAVRLSPGDPAAYKALGFVHAARGELMQASTAFERATALNKDAWDAWLNLGELHDRAGEKVRATADYEQAYEAMARSYDDQAVRLRTWYPQMGVLIAERYARDGDHEVAAKWYRRVLDESPYYPAATAGLAQSLVGLGEFAAARRLCSELIGRLGDDMVCPAR